MHQLALGDGRLGVERLTGGQVATGQREHPQRAARHVRGAGEDLAATVVRERNDRPAVQFRRAARHDRLRRPFRQHQAIARRRANDDAHPLALGVERNLEDHRRRRILRRHAPLERRDHQRPLGRITDHLPATAVARRLHRGTAAAGGDEQQPTEVRVGGRDGHAVGHPQKLAPGLVATARDPIPAARRHDLADRHLVAGQRSGLVRADHRHRSERLHARQPADQRVAGHHPLQADGEHERDDRRQPLRHGGHREAHPAQQHLAQSALPPQGHQPAAPPGLQQEDDPDDDQTDHDQHPAQFGEPALQRRRLRRRPLEQARDPSELGLHAGFDHEGRPAACGHDGARMHDRAAIAERRGLRQRPGRNLLHRHALAGEGRLLHPQPEGLDQPGVGRHLIAGLEFDPVAGHDRPCRHRLQRPVAHDLGQRRGEPLQCRQRPQGPLLLKKADRGVDHHDRQDRRRVGPVSHRRRDAGRDQQDPDHELLELRENFPPPGLRRRFRERVGAVAGETADGLRGREPVRGIRLQPAGDRGQVEGMPERVGGGHRRPCYGIRRRSTTSGSASSRTLRKLIGFARTMPATKPAMWAE